MIEKTILAQTEAEAERRKQSVTKCGDDCLYKKWWADKECFNCHKIGHPSYHCPKKDRQSDDDDRSVATAASVKNAAKGGGDFDKYSKTAVVKTGTSERLSFAKKREEERRK
jgi:hypothetical protein